MKKILIIALLCGIFAAPAFAEKNYKKQSYDLFIVGRILDWDGIVDSLKAEPARTLDQDIELLTYYYGLVGHLMDIDKKKARAWLDEAMPVITPLLEKYPDDARLVGLMANFKGFAIALSPLKAATLARSMLQLARRAPQLAPENPEANIWGANILFYMPNALGGNTKQSKVYYQKAMELYENNEALRANNWMYLQLIVTLGLVEEKAGNYEGALEYYQKVMRLFPDYPHVKEVLYPRVVKEMEKK